MKAAVLTHYDRQGTDLEIREVPVPELGGQMRCLSGSRQRRSIRLTI